MRQFNNITIIGVGLIGGSIGLAIKKRRLSKDVIGVFRRGSTLRKALLHKAVDWGTMDMKEGVSDADLVILATPVASIPSVAGQVIKLAKEGAVITDVGSTKRWIVENVERHLRRGARAVYFVGSHPMAGSERTSVEFAKDNLFDKASCIVTKTKRTNTRALGAVINFWSSLGAKVTAMSPVEHDRVAAFISHLPHLVSFSLAGTVADKYISYGAEGFGDTTRVASSDPKLWADIFLTNKEEILRSCRLFERYIGGIEKALSRGDRSRIIKMLKTAKTKRDKFVYEK
ncbi:MAG: hypothetical protein A2987_06815 [Omnitrophica bacterium RIFCSPLOWO2_01_FULL_45_10]|nr:MAG: hypothetical protein A2987_06815 [Omnitrophica bacterium RIFCSPLOWO2_01_FULL_45_10]